MWLLKGKSDNFRQLKTVSILKKIKIYPEINKFSLLLQSIYFLFLFILIHIFLFPFNPYYSLT